MLYPKRTLPGFLERNLIPDAVVASTPLLRALIEAGDRTLVIRDVAGQARFDAGVVNDGALTVALDALGADPQWTDAVATGREAVREAYETVFHHRAFTGRSGTMYGYEGLGCIYWHMVAKLMLAVQEGCREAAETGADPAAQRRLAAHYYAVRGGLGFNKTARVYGAFPQDPYSHTPAHTGAKQPGMTGQVKEELLARWGELGVVIGDGQIRFRPTLLRAEEFLADARPWSYYGIDGAAEIVLPSDALGFTLCQTPVVYTLTDGPARVAVSLDDAHTITLDGDCLPADLSAQVFGRTGRVQRIDVTVPRGALLD
jgi:hypothetical protein